jgi:hypothetical protein
MKKSFVLSVAALVLAAALVFTGCPTDSSDNGGPSTDPGTTQESAIALTTQVWTDGELTTVGEVRWYKFTATSGTTYNVYLNNIGSGNGDGTKTGFVKISAFKSDGSSIFENVASAYGSPRTFVGDGNTVYLKVQEYASLNYGTYAIKVSE